MSIKDYNKVINISSALTGEVLATVNANYLYDAQGYIDRIVFDQIENEEGILIKVGYKS